MGYTEHSDEWDEYYARGHGFKRLSEAEQGLLKEHLAAPAENGAALDVGCGTGELAAYLAGLGYTVDAVDASSAAIARARSEHGGAGVRWLGLDVEHDDLSDLAEDGYDLVTMRLCVAFIRDRSRVLRRMGARLRPGGALVVITPVLEYTPEERRNIALDEDELSVLSDGFTDVARFDVEGLAVLVLRGPGGSFTAAEKNRPDPQAVFGAAVVVTDSCGRVLLGRSTRGMWELPGGRVETGESAATAAVREPAEEAGLTVRVGDAHVLALVHDDRQDVRRLSAVVRVARWDGALGLPEPHRFSRWEWHDLHTLATLGTIFAPSAQALNAVWPGVLPGLPAVHSYAHAPGAPPVAGEPAEAVRLRTRMTEAVIAGGWAPSAPVQAALRAVPRHRFVPEVPLETAYNDDLAVVTVRDDAGAAVSSVSAPWLQADMIEQLQLAPGKTVLEVGAGGYNASLMAHIVGARGRVVTVDIDPYVVRRTERLCAETGTGQVTAVLGDGSLGAPGHAPATGYDGVLITHNAADIAPAWREQLTEGGRLVVPLEMGGYTRSLALERRGNVLRTEHWTFCGFVRDRGTAARTAQSVPLADGALTVRWDDHAPRDTQGIEETLHTKRYEAATGVVMPGAYSYETLQLYAATTLPDFCRLAASDQLVAGPARYGNLAALLANGSVAYITCIKIREAPRPADRRFEFYVHAYGPSGPDLADQLIQCVRNWDRHIRDSGYPPMTIHPAETPDDQLPPGDVLDKTHSRLDFQWPGRTPHYPHNLSSLADPRT